MNYFRQHSIQSIHLEGDNLIITYQSGNSETRTVSNTGNKTKSQMRCDKCGFKKDFDKGQPALLACPKCGAEAGNGFDYYEVPAEDDITQLQQISSYLQGLPNRSVSLRELEQGSSSGGDPKKPTNYWPWIIGGGIILVLIVIIAYLLTRNKNKEIK